MLSLQRVSFSLPRLPRFLRRKNKPVAPSETIDLLLLDSCTHRLSCLQRITHTPEHPLFNIAADCKKLVKDSYAASEGKHPTFNAVAVLIDKLTSSLQSLSPELVSAEEVADIRRRKPNTSLGGGAAASSSSSSVNHLEKEAYLRVLHGKEYFQRLQKALGVDQEISTTHRQLESADAVVRMVDTVLVGTASERIEMHLRLYAEKMTPGEDATNKKQGIFSVLMGSSPQEVTPIVSSNEKIEMLTQIRMQECFYFLYEAEIETAKKMLLLQSKHALHKHHIKRIQKFSTGYLLDKAELNTKIRCVMAWADPGYSKGFEVLDNTFTMPLNQLIPSRREFYPEGDQMGQQFMKDFTGQRRAYYYTKKENRETLMMGFAFFVATCLLDWAVCTI